MCAVLQRLPPIYFFAEDGKIGCTVAEDGDKHQNSQSHSSTSTPAATSSMPAVLHIGRKHNANISFGIRNRC